MHHMTQLWAKQAETQLTPIFNLKNGYILSPPPVFLWPPVTIYMLLHSTLLCKKIARAPGGYKKFLLTKLGGGGGGQTEQIHKN